MLKDKVKYLFLIEGWKYRLNELFWVVLLRAKLTIVNLVPIATKRQNKHYFFVLRFGADRVPFLNWSFSSIQAMSFLRHSLRSACKP